jgi:hypothetical protein
MKRVIFYLFATLSSFSFSTAVTVFCINTVNPSTQKVEKPLLLVEKENITTEMPILAFCELANNPEKYDGKIMRVSAKLVGYEDGFAFRDLNCYGEKKAAVLEDGRFYAQTTYQIMDKLGKGRYAYSEEIEIIAVVKFNRIKPTGKTYRFIDHAHLLIEIMKVEKARELD